MALKTFNFKLLMLLSIFIVFTACSDDDDGMVDPTPPIEENSILDIISGEDDLSTLVTVASGFPDVVDALNNPDAELTLFAPTNDAFTDFLELYPNLTNDQIEEILTFHVLASIEMAADLSDGQTLATLQGENLIVSIDGASVMINDANVTEVDLEAVNGVIHKIDMVLVPSTVPTQTIAEIAVGNEDFSLLVEAVTRFDDLTAAISSRESQLTVFAPTNDAFQALLDSNDDWNSLDDISDELLKDVLEFHVAAEVIASTDLSEGQEITMLNGAVATITLENGHMIEDANIAAADIFAVNGVVHVIDMVILPPQPMSIAEIAVEDENFSILVEAVSKFPDLLTAISDESSMLTVFAPTNAAFADLLASNPEWNTLDDIDEATLEAVLEYHILTSEVFSSALSNSRAETLNGKYIDINIDNGVMINDAMVTTADVDATNGVIHVIDKVLIPLNNIVEEAVAVDDLSTLVAAVTKFPDIVSALSDESAQLTVFAPTNDAFQALLDSNDDWNSLDDIDEATLLAVLQYHVAAAKVTSDMLEETTYTMLDGNDISVSLADGVTINGNSDVVIPDVAVSNGVVHVIDQVLLPPASN
ncbi:hypothetical protein PEDI_14610 [Persicobacter diffluens]|uniref:FAS1 domain-containing protein n=2 Tax=Persicobacter diffluens TaxID=981 RepID=A0AAN5AJE4_9BACT|nr:hypothetical protein PEDI_14610 [Persicobacter diffluens]